METGQSDGNRLLHATVSQLPETHFSTMNNNDEKEKIDLQV